MKLGSLLKTAAVIGGIATLVIPYQVDETEEGTVYRAPLYTYTHEKTAKAPADGEDARVYHSHTIKIPGLIGDQAKMVRRFAEDVEKKRPHTKEELSECVSSAAKKAAKAAGEAGEALRKTAADAGETIAEKIREVKEKASKDKDTVETTAEDITDIGEDLGDVFEDTADAAGTEGSVSGDGVSDGTASDASFF